MNGHTKRMCQQHRCRSREPVILAKPVTAQTAPAWRVATPGDTSLTSRKPVGQALLSGPKGTLGGGSIENQVARLSDTRLPIRQRQTLAAEIGGVQGNRWLQRVMARVRENKGGTEMYSDPPHSYQKRLRLETQVHERAAPGVTQRIIAIGGTDLDAARVASAQNEITTTYLADIVNNTSRNLMFTRQYRERLIRDTVLDMHQASTRFRYGSVAELASDVRQRVLASLYMRQSQGRTPTLKGFSYPNRASDRTTGCGPRVNEKAHAYWGPVQDPGGDYHFQLSPTGRLNAYQAIVTLFHEQTNPCHRTLIHCDYLLSVIQYRAWAESIGIPNFNAGVQAGHIPLVLKWNGFKDLERPTSVPRVGTTMPAGVETPLQRVDVASESDLIIGDHVVFYNHESYDALIAGVGGIWRLENAIVTNRRGGENFYQGHGYFSPVPKSVLLAGMIRQYNRHVAEALQLARNVEHASSAGRPAALAQLQAKYPKVRQKVAGGWEIAGTGFCGNLVTRDLRNLTASEAPGFIHPCTGRISVRRPVHTRP